MPDEAPAVEQDQPTTPAAPETDQPTGDSESFADFDPSEVPEDADRAWFEKRLGELQAGWTQKTQGLSQERQEAQEYREFAEAMQDPAIRDRILEQEFGYQFEDDGAEEEWLDPEEELAARVERLEGRLTQQQQAELAAAQEEETTEFVAEEIEALEKSQGDGFEFSPKELAFISTYAHTHPQPNGAPDVKGAGAALTEMLDQRKQQWVESKKSPRRISQGSPASKTVEPKDRGERMEMALEAMEEAEA